VEDGEFVGRGRCVARVAPHFGFCRVSGRPTRPKEEPARNSEIRERRASLPRRQRERKMRTGSEKERDAVRSLERTVGEGVEGGCGRIVYGVS
jgi:hypothetical protein